MKIREISGIQVETCELTTRICPVDPHVGNYQECFRRVWQLDQIRKARKDPADQTTE